MKSSYFCFLWEISLNHFFHQDIVLHDLPWTWSYEKLVYFKMCAVGRFCMITCTFQRWLQSVVACGTIVHHIKLFWEEPKALALFWEYCMLSNAEDDINNIIINSNLKKYLIYSPKACTFGSSETLNCPWVWVVCAMMTTGIGSRTPRDPE